MAVEDLDKKLDSLLSDKEVNWKEKADWRAKNKGWLKHSRKIAIKINSILKERKLTQKKLAEMLEVSPQQVSKIIKGRENLTLETISKIEKVLSIELIHISSKESVSDSLKNPKVIVFHFSVNPEIQAERPGNYNWAFEYKKNIPFLASPIN
ncbi:MAG: helix-turn-helix transcriptional regulator [Bacteroidia bacterium]